MRVSQTFLLLTGIALASTLVASLAVPPAHIAPSPGPDTAQNSLHAFTMEKRQAFRPAPGPLGSDGTGFGVGGGRGYASKQEAHEEEADGNAVPEQPQEEQVEGQEGGQVSAATGTGTMSGETVVEIATQDLETISHLIVASATLTPGTPDPARTRPPADPTSFGPTVPLRVSTYVDPNAPATTSTSTGQGTVSNAGAGLGGPATSSSAAGVSGVWGGVGRMWVLGVLGVCLGGGLAGVGNVY